MKLFFNMYLFLAVPDFVVRGLLIALASLAAELGIQVHRLQGSQV